MQSIRRDENNARTSLFQLFSLRAVHAACQHENTNANRPDLDGDLFDLFRSILLQQMQGDRETELIMRFQQPPVHGWPRAALTDSWRLTKWGDPGQVRSSPDDFHKACISIQHQWPRSMLASSTHDT